MFKQVRKLAATALCALTLTVLVGAPAHAHDIVVGRAGQIQKLVFSGKASTAAKIAGEFVGLIHVVHMDHEAGKLYWNLLTRDGKQTVLVAEAIVDEERWAILSEGEIAQGALKGAKVSFTGYRDGDVYRVDLKVALGDTTLAFSQVLRALSGQEQRTANPGR